MEKLDRETTARCLGIKVEELDALVAHGEIYHHPLTGKDGVPVAFLWPDIENYLIEHEGVTLARAQRRIATVLWG